jgi:holo-[acyl-carrier protein] synthase
MIIGIGCDIVNHDITKKLDWEFDTQTLRRFFSPKELALYETNKSVKFLAGRFAAKEALLKCLGTGICDGVSLTDIEILQLENGRPNIAVYGGVKEGADKMGITFWHVSITHSVGSSTAFVMAEGKIL